MLLIDIYKHLLNTHQVTLVPVNPVNPVQPPYSKWYNANDKCEYHASVMGHSKENYSAFKNKVSALIKHGWISFDGPNGFSNINPLPTYTKAFSSTVNVIRNEESIKLLKLDAIKVQMQELFDKLTKARYIKLVLSSHDGFLGDGKVYEYC